MPQSLLIHGHRVDPDDPACFCLLGYRRYLQAVQDLVGDPLHKVPLSLVEFVGTGLNRP